MSKILKIFLTLFILSILVFNFNFVFATSDESLQSGIEDLAEVLNEEEINPLADNPVGENEENLETLSDETEEIIESTPAPSSTEENLSEGSQNPLSASSVTKVSTINSYEQANLQLNNILSIILIAIGVLLILFAIAILIRLSK